MFTFCYPLPQFPIFMARPGSFIQKKQSFIAKLKAPQHIHMGFFVYKPITIKCLYFKIMSASVLSDM